MKKVISAVIFAVMPGLALAAGSAELNVMRAADVAALMSGAAVPVAAPAAVRSFEAGVKTAEFHGHGYSVWQADSKAKAQAELDSYTSVLKNNGVKIVKAEVQEVEGWLEAKVSYEGKEVLFRENGSALTTFGAKIKMEKRVQALQAGGAVILRSEAYTGHDEWGSGGAYAIEYFLKEAGKVTNLPAALNVRNAGIESVAALAQDQWKHVGLNAADGTRLNIDYILNGYHGESSITASPWINVSNAAFKGDEQLTAVLINYYANTGQLEGTRNITLKYAGDGRFTAQAEPVDVRFFSHSGSIFSFRQEIAVVVNGSWLEVPVTGGHNFGFVMDAK